MITYWIAAKRPMFSRTWTLHPEVVISRTRHKAIEKLHSLVTIPEDHWAIAVCHVPENWEDEALLERGEE